MIKIIKFKLFIFFALFIPFIFPAHADIKYSDGDLGAVGHQVKPNHSGKTEKSDSGWGDDGYAFYDLGSFDLKQKKSTHAKGIKKKTYSLGYEDAFYTKKLKDDSGWIAAGYTSYNKGYFDGAEDIKAKAKKRGTEKLKPDQYKDVGGYEIKKSGWSFDFETEKQDSVTPTKDKPYETYQEFDISYTADSWYDTYLPDWPKIFELPISSQALFFIIFAISTFLTVYLKLWEVVLVGWRYGRTSYAEEFYALEEQQLNGEPVSRLDWFLMFGRAFKTGIESTIGEIPLGQKLGK